MKDYMTDEKAIFHNMAAEEAEKLASSVASGRGNDREMQYESRGLHRQSVHSTEFERHDDKMQAQHDRVLKEMRNPDGCAGSIQGEDNGFVGGNDRIGRRTDLLQAQHSTQQDAVVSRMRNPDVYAGSTLGAVSETVGGNDTMERRMNE